MCFNDSINMPLHAAQSHPSIKSQLLNQFIKKICTQSAAPAKIKYVNPIEQGDISTSASAGLQYSICTEMSYCTQCLMVNPSIKLLARSIAFSFYSIALIVSVSR